MGECRKKKKYERKYKGYNKENGRLEGEQRQKRRKDDENGRIKKK